MNEELNFYKKEIQTLRSEKETLEDVLNRKAGDIRKNLANEVLRYALYSIPQCLLITLCLELRKK